MITVLVVDDNPTVRVTLRTLLESSNKISVVGEASNGEEGLAVARRLRPNVTLLDYRMPVADGLSVVGFLASHTAVLVLTSSPEPELIGPMLGGGARGYLVYGQFEPPELIRAIREVASGRAWLSPTAASVATTAIQEQVARERAKREQAESRRAARRTFGLTEREEEVMELLCLGLSNISLAHQLGLSDKTVKNHLNHIFGKLGVSSRTEAVVCWTDT
jgi:DNA-binding NarL/FixJ family response regulator